MTHDEFIAAIAGYVQKYAKDYGILVHSPIIAQAILESGWGNSKLASVYHNYFGMKCGSKWTGKSVNMVTQEEYKAGTMTTITAFFRVYDSKEEGVKGYFEFLQLPRYENLKGITDPKTYLETLKADGYATSSTYVTNNYNLIKQYDLTKYDNGAEENGTESEGSETSMAVKIGSARSSYGNTTRGDQHSGSEVSTQNWYLHSLGWRVFRAIDVTKQALLARAMANACAQDLIGYSQSDRLALLNQLAAQDPATYDPAKVTSATNCDCSSLVRVCCYYAGIRPDNFITSNEAAKLLATGEFTELTDSKYTKSSDYLRAGDILVTRTKGHTVIVLTNGSKVSSDTGTATKTYKLGERVLQNGCAGSDVKELQTLLISAGYDCGNWGADGDFGDATELAVVAFQKQYGFSQNGVATSAIVDKLCEVCGNESNNDGKYVEIVGGNCYIRSVASTAGVKLGTAHKGETYAYAGETSDAGWHSITIKDGSTGWVSGLYSAIKG